MFIDDPADLIAPVESVWPEYIENGDQLLREAEASVVQWRLARDHSFLPNHPFYRTIDTREVDDYRKESAFQQMLSSGFCRESKY
ncbi:MAG: hypothetical protein QF805_13555 [Pirellulaceae bacterium]|jgi:hypothetical protein|nr:hypothetical protein [Pirellulaceae bacterium]